MVVLFIHRIILERILDRKLLEYEICDHINGNPMDNRRCNLRIATHAENMRNSKKRKHSKNQYKGVSQNCKSKTTWRAQIRVNGKRIHLGTFSSPEEAYKAYCEGAVKYHGDFAKF